MPHNRPRLLGRVGTFFITDASLQDEGSFDNIRKIMGECLIVSAIHNYGFGRFEYIAMCEQFDEVPLGHKAPHYIATMVGSKVYFLPSGDDNDQTD